MDLQLFIRLCLWHASVTTEVDMEEIYAKMREEIYTESDSLIAPDSPRATAKRISGEEVFERFGAAAFEEILDKGSFLKPFNH